MAGLFSADIRARRLWEIDPALLTARGVRGVLLDIDNTLTTHDSQHLPPEVPRWLDAARAQGLLLLLVSNNSAERVAPFAAKIGLDFYAKAAKPLPGGYRRAAAKLGLAPAQVAMVGDQIFTDSLGANAAGMVSVLLEPIEPESTAFFRFKRFCERPLRWAMARRDR